MSIFNRKVLAFSLCTVGSLLVAGMAQADVAVFNLNGTYTNPDPWFPSINDHFILSGQITWTYPTGQFGSGTGTVDFLTQPFGWIYPQPGSINSLDLGGIAASQNGNTHDYTYDLAINFNNPLTGPSSSSTLSGSYDFSPVSNAFFGNGEAIGTVSGTITPYGSAVPEPATCALVIAGIAAAITRRTHKQ